MNLLEPLRRLGRRARRQLKAQSLVTSYIFTGLTIRVLIRDKWLFKRVMTRVASVHCTAMLKALNMQTDIRGLSDAARARMRKQAGDPGEGLMIVANHLSYLDVLILPTVAPMLFISSVEMKMTPLVGLMADLGGTLFVERRNKDKISEEINEISEALHRGFNVVLFAEATSSDGSSVLPFKRSMLTAAAQTGASLLPLTINYRELDGKPVTKANRDRLCWYGDMTFLPHFKQVIANESATVELTFHPSVQLAKDADTKPVAQALHTTIAEWFHPFF